MILTTDNSDGHIQSANTTYATARSGSTLGVLATSTTMTIGQQISAGTYTCRQVFLAFNTSGLSTEYVVTALRVRFNNNGGNGTGFTLQARPYAWTAPLTTADWVSGDSFAALPLVATFACVDTTAESFTWGTFIDLGLDSVINRTGLTKFVIAIDQFADGTIPSVTTNRSLGTWEAGLAAELELSSGTQWCTGDRVKETTTTTGTGTLTLAGAVSGFQAFSAIATDLTNVPYAIVGATEWEVGIGLWRTGNFLVRGSVLASSNSGALVSFSAGTKDVFCTLPADHGLMPLARQTQVTDVLIPSKSSTYVQDYELTAGKAVELGPGAAMEIG